MLLAGYKVKVYSKPITMEELEGEAFLVERVRPDEGDGLSIWMVEFTDEPGSVYQRTIKEKRGIK